MLIFKQLTGRITMWQLFSGVSESRITKLNDLLNQILNLVEHEESKKRGSFLGTDGLTRIPGDEALSKKIATAFMGAPQKCLLGDLEQYQQLVSNPNDIMSLLKKVLKESNLEWSEEAQSVFLQADATWLNVEDESQGLNNLIESLINARAIEEAKLLHNLIYLSQQIASHEDKNQMTASNVAISFLGPQFMNVAPESFSAEISQYLRRQSLMTIKATQAIKEALTQTNRFYMPFSIAYPHLERELRGDIAKEEQPSSDSWLSLFGNLLFGEDRQLEISDAVCLSDSRDMRSAQPVTTDRTVSLAITQEQLTSGLANLRKRQP